MVNAKFIADLFNSLSTLQGDNKYKVNPTKLQDEIQERLFDWDCDRRYKLFIKARDTNCNSFIVEYQNRQFYLSFNNATNLYEAESHR